MKRLAVILLSAALAAGCQKDSWKASYVETLTVEGWISAGGYPYVTVSVSSPPVFDFRSTDELIKYVVRWAKVTVDDGENSVVLTGRAAPDYFPPFIYTSTKMMGEAGKTYNLTVEYGGVKATASTYIPEPLPLDSIAVVKSPGCDTLYSIFAYFTDPPETRDFYKILTKVDGRDSTFLAASLGNIDDSVFGAGGKVSVEVDKGRTSRFVLDGVADETLGVYSYGAKVHFRFGRVDEDSFRFWDAFERSTSFYLYPFFQTRDNLPSNVDGAVGCWCGYGMTEYFTVIN